MEIIKDVYTPKSDMDILTDLNKKKPKMRIKAEKKPRSLRSKFAVLALVGISGILGSALLTAQAVKSTQSFFEANKIEYHNILDIKVNSPVTIEKRKPVVEYVRVAGEDKLGKAITQKEKEEVIRKASFSKIILGFWTLETSKGKGGNSNDPTNHQSNCEKVGMTNEFGYDPSGKTCFASFEESVAFLDKYIGTNLQNLSMNELLCYYRYGQATDTCDYAQRFHALDKAGELALK